MPTTEDRARLAHLMRLVATIGVVVCAAFGLLYVGLGSPIAALGPALAALAFLITAALVRTGRYQRAPLALGVSLIVGLAISSWRFGGLDAPMLPWLPFPLLIAVLVGERRDAWLTAVVTAAAVAVLAALPPRQDGTDAELLWMRVGNVAAVTVMAVLLALSAERARAASTARLESANAALALARDAADAANRAKSEVMANVSHELRTPLHAVIGMTDLLLHGALDADQREQARVARAAAGALDELIADVLDAARLDAGALKLVLAPCDVGAVVRRVVDMVRARAEERGLAFELQLERSPCELLCDEARVRQIITNLVDNAVKFTESGAIRVRLVFEGTAGSPVRVGLDVEDTGIGMSPATLTMVFERFRQADSSSTRRYRGTGLGLSIARDLATLMGGTLTVRSALGQGSTFTLSFAAASAARNGPPT